MKKIALSAAVLLLGTALASAQAGSLSLDGDAWRLMRDPDALWEEDRLYLPAELPDLSLLEVHPPSGGWESLNAGAGMPVRVPGSVEEYTTVSSRPQPEDSRGVSWWWRDIRVPSSASGGRVILRFGSVRQRAEVYLDGILVCYDIVGETPFEADITRAVKFGERQRLAVRITNPGGNYHWQDFNTVRWGAYNIPPARGFSGILGSVSLDLVPTVRISDIYMQNTLTPTKVNAVIELENASAQARKETVGLVVRHRGTGEIVWRKKLGKRRVCPGISVVEVPVELPGARLWSPADPQLYVCEVTLAEGRKTGDRRNRTFGFRSFAPDGVGEEAVLRLNGKRVVLRSAISWGYFPVTGLTATHRMAVKQVEAARSMGLNMLNFHRCIGQDAVLDAADSLGLFYYEEPGSYQSGGRDPFTRALLNEKIRRMIRRDRSHPSLVIYNLINEYGGSSDQELIGWRMEDMRRAHALDVSRMITFTSGWASREQDEEDSKAHFRPFDDTLYRRGWFDNHRAGGPSTWEEKFYQGPADNIMFTDNHTEVYMRGEEAAISTPPRIELIHNEIESSGKTGWDGLFWEGQYRAFRDYFERNGLRESFGSLDSLTRAMGKVQLDHQGRRIQAMRSGNLGDVYVINGWESMPYDNHSGVVDLYRNPKSDPSVLSYYNQDLYVAVMSRNQVLRVPGKASVDLYAVNEKDLRGAFTLDLFLKAPDGSRRKVGSYAVNLEGGDRYGQLLAEAVEVELREGAGLYTLEADLGGVAAGSEQLLGVEWSAEELSGSGALYGDPDDGFARFYRQAAGRDIELFSPASGKLDYLIVNRSSLDEPEAIPEANLRNLHLTWFRDNDIRDKAGEEDAREINRSFVAGAQPASCLPANHTFSALWEGDLVSSETGLHLLGVEASGGVRIWVGEEQVLDAYWNRRPMTETRPVLMEAGKPVHIRVGYYQHEPQGSISLKWSRPGAAQISSSEVLDRARYDGTTVVIIGKAETWMKEVARVAGLDYKGHYTVGHDWIGGIHFALRHPLLQGLPQGVALDWPYQALVRDGDNRYGFLLEGVSMAVGSYRSWPFYLGVSTGVVPYGKGRIVFSTLRIPENLDDPSGPAEVARRLLLNMINCPLIS